MYLYTWFWFYSELFLKIHLELATHVLLQINIMMANGDKKTIRKNVTERMYSVSFPTNWLSVFVS